MLGRLFPIHRRAAAHESKENVQLRGFPRRSGAADNGEPEGASLKQLPNTEMHQVHRLVSRTELLVKLVSNSEWPQLNSAAGCN